MSYNIRELYALNKDDIAIIEKKNQLYRLYSDWVEKYKEYYKYHLIQEYLDLKTEFPDIDFSIEARIKSEYSYRDKVDRKISEGNTGRVYDIFACKITINSVNGQTDENLLIDACYKFEDFLNNKSRDSITIPNKSKDYIKSPKPNGYKSIHLNRITQGGEHMDQSFFSETQIKTFRMRQHEKTGEASHSQSYKSRTPLLNYIHSREQAEFYLPRYLLFVHNTKGNFLAVMEKGLDERFEYFFGLNLGAHIAQIRETKFELR